MTKQSKLFPCSVMCTWLHFNYFLNVFPVYPSCGDVTSSSLSATEHGCRWVEVNHPLQPGCSSNADA